MANYSTLKAAVADVVKTNGTQAITGANLQAVLLSIINSVGGGGYIFKGVATPSTDAGTPDENVFYIGGAGTYANFGTSVAVPVGSICLFKYNGSWVKEQIKMFEGIDDVPTAGSDNLVKSGGAAGKINQLELDLNQLVLVKDVPRAAWHYFPIGTPLYPNNTYRFSVTAPSALSATLFCRIYNGEDTEVVAFTITSGNTNGYKEFVPTTLLNDNVRFAFYHTASSTINGLNISLQNYGNITTRTEHLEEVVGDGISLASDMAASTWKFTKIIPLKAGHTYKATVTIPSPVANAGVYNIITNLPDANDTIIAACHIAPGNTSSTVTFTPSLDYDITYWDYYCSAAAISGVTFSIEETTGLYYEVMQEKEQIEKHDNELGLFIALNKNFPTTGWHYTPLTSIKQGHTYRASVKLQETRESTNMFNMITPAASSANVLATFNVVPGNKEATTTFTADNDYDIVYWSVYISAQTITGAEFTFGDVTGLNDRMAYADEVIPTLEPTRGLVKGILHRGYETIAPENTAPAFILAARHNVKYVETDVRVTSDGVPVLLHDETINRTARNADGTELSETINIADITYAQALTYDFGIWKGAEYAGTKIMSFEDFIALCRNLGLHPYIDMKTQTEASAILQYEIALRYGMRRNCTWASSNWNDLGFIKNADPYARLGIIGSSVTSELLGKIIELKTDNNDVFYDTLTHTASEIAACKAENIPLEVYNMNNEVAIKSLDTYISGVTSSSLDASIILRKHYLD